MTSFCGRVEWRGVERGPADAAAQGRAIAAMARAGGAVHLYEDAAAWIAYHDLGAFEAGRALASPHASAVAVSGDPLLETPGGHTSDADALAAVLGAGDLAALGRAQGQFAAASWDAPAATLRLCADKLAGRPVYVHHAGGVTRFATQLRVLRAMAGDPLAIDEAGLGEIMHFQFALGDRTQYRDVRALRPGELLTITPAGRASAIYHDWARAPAAPLDLEATLDRLHAAFLEAVRRRSRCEREEAFLSGGMDSRAVVAGLIGIGRRVRSFGTSYAQSADDVLSRLAAERMGTDHTADIRDPAARLALAGDPFALYARANFPPDAESTGRARALWSGDGGSVGMGHVYMTAAQVEAAGGAIDDAAVVRLLGALAPARTRVVRPRDAARLRELAIAGAKDELERVGGARPDRRLFLFYLLNDQMRHLYGHYEEIDRSGLEFHTPFFDAGLLEAIVAAPTAWFLNHRFYNAWIARFAAPAAAIPWQVYPGHEPGPHPMPAGIRAQWSASWYDKAAARAQRLGFSASVLATTDARVRRYIDLPALALVRRAVRLGATRWGYELSHARRVRDAIAGGAPDADAPAAWTAPAIVRQPLDARADAADNARVPRGAARG